MIEIIVQKFEDHTEVTVRRDGININSYVFDDEKAHQAFIHGMNCMKNLCNYSIQSISTDYKVQKIS